MAFIRDFASLVSLVLFLVSMLAWRELFIPLV
jgi:hypothetical protein